MSRLANTKELLPEVLRSTTSTVSKTLTRREFLKGTTYASVLSVGGLSGLVSANSASLKPNATSKSSKAGDSGLFAVTLTNQSDHIVALNPSKPVSLEKVNGWVVVKINKVSTPDVGVVTGQQISLAPGQQCSFPVDAELAPMLTAGSTDIVITNEYSALNNLVPMMPFGSMAA